MFLSKFPPKLPRWMGLLPGPGELKPSRYRVEVGGGREYEVTALDSHVAMREALKRDTAQAPKAKVGFLIKAKNLDTGETTRYPAIGFLLSI